MEELKEYLIKYVDYLEKNGMNITSDDMEVVKYVESNSELKDIVPYINKAVTRESRISIIEKFIEEKEFEKKNQDEQLKAAIGKKFGVDLSEIDHMKLQNGVEIIAFYDKKLGRKRLIDYSYAKSLVEEFSNIQNNSVDFQTEDEKANSNEIAEREANQNNNKRELEMIDIERFKAESDELIKRAPKMDSKKLECLNELLKEAEEKNIKYINIENVVALDDKNNIIESYYNEEKGIAEIVTPEKIASKKDKVDNGEEENLEADDQDNTIEKTGKLTANEANKTKKTQNDFLKNAVTGERDIINDNQRIVAEKYAHAKGKETLLKKALAAKDSMAGVLSQLVSSLSMGDAKDRELGEKLSGLAIGIRDANGNVDLTSVITRVSELSFQNGIDLSTRFGEAIRTLQNGQDAYNNAAIAIANNFGDEAVKNHYIDSSQKVGSIRDSKSLNSQISTAEIQTKNVESLYNKVVEVSTQSEKESMARIADVAAALYEDIPEYVQSNRQQLNNKQVDASTTESEQAEEIVTAEDIDLENEMKICSIEGHPYDILQNIKWYEANMEKLDDDLANNRISQEEFDFYEMMCGKYKKQMSLKKTKVKTLEYDPNSDTKGIISTTLISILAMGLAILLAYLIV